MPPTFGRHCNTRLNEPEHTLCHEKWNESGFRPPLCTYRLNWAKRTSWGWWDDLGDTVLQTQDSKFEPWRSEADHAISRSRRLPTILTFTRGWGRNIICFFQTAETGNQTPNSGVKGSGANHYPRAPAHCVMEKIKAIKGIRITILPWKSKRQYLLTCKVNRTSFWLCKAELLCDNRHTLVAGDCDIKSNVSP